MGSRKRVLVGDVGGTKSLLAVAEVEGERTRFSVERSFPSARYDSLEALVREFVAETGARAEAACFGVPCPVVGEECRVPNLPWTVGERRLAEAAGVPRARLVNDFIAVGWGIGRLAPEDVVTLQEGEPDPRGAIALLGAGTGLGAGFLVWDGERRRPQPSEGGHADFAPRDDLEWGLAGALRREHGHVSWERVLSGAGLAAAYRHLVASGAAPAAPVVEEEMRGEEPAAVVSRHALAGTDEGCRRALDLFVSLYGAEAGNLALEVLATGGMYLAGGIAPRIVGRLREGGFLRSFRDKGRFAGLMERIPVRVIVSPRAALLGAAAVGAGLAEGGGR
jgi:glucokinase